tara:strand:- start:711 stop:1964 length:1254 start_codon:yes stop_codon:yes gene_type:complete
MKKFLIFIIWLFSLIIVSFYTYEHPETIERIKHYIKFNKEPDIKLEKSDIQKVVANSFSVEFSKVISLSEKTAFIIHDERVLKFNKNDLKIYTQNGYLIKNLKFEKLNLPDAFTTQRNGGIKTIFIHNNNEFALISATKTNCFYAAIVSLDSGEELFKTKCLTGSKKETDFNGLGSSNIHHKNKILLSIGAPEQASSKIRMLAQDNQSVFGKIVEINQNDVDKIISGEEENLNLKIFSMGHRNPQGLTKIKDSFFSVEHGPLGGDELNKIIKDKNYGWPIVSYGTQYLYDESGKSYKISHENNAFEEPLFALVPSVGISSLNNCPEILKNFYKKPCLLALSLYGNNLRPGRSIIIYLLNNKMNQVHSVEQIHLKNDLLFRHFVTNSKNELYEDEKGNIYVSADKVGIYKLSFVDFRN